jgi:protein-L-isoaspartate(D-aspartate) O-methyltransferase
MVDTQIAARGVRDPRVLAAMRAVPRERFLTEGLAEFAYDDSALPIEEEQTISQPFIVALMAAAAQIGQRDRVLEIGTGSGYAAAIFAELAAEVYTVERHAALAEQARRRLEELGNRNVKVHHGDGTLGWPEHASYDAIVVAAGGPDVPPALREQLAIGGRLVMPIGADPRSQTLIRVMRKTADSYERDSLGEVRFVPLVGEAGWDDADVVPLRAPAPSTAPATIARLLAETSEPLSDIDGVDLAPLLDRIGNARVVLLGEATHGTSEFYRMRARITRELVLRRGFTVVALEADWPDSARVDQYARHLSGRPAPEKPFSRFPTWMWRNLEFTELVEWLRAYNGSIEAADRRVGCYGLDLYSLYTSIDAVLRYLDSVDAEAAAVARRRYGCLTPWQGDPGAYGRAVVTGGFRGCEAAAVQMLRDMLDRRIAYMTGDGDRFLDALQNARVVADAERYYRVMYYGSRESWNLRDQHMFETLQTILAFRGPETKAVVWEHNSHVGDAAATEMGVRGELNVGRLCRAEYGDTAYLVGFGTDHGTVAAATDWDVPMEVKRVRPAHPESYERLCHESGRAAFLLALRNPVRDAVRVELAPPRLERAIGVIYRPDTELQSHYFQATLPVQFDEYVWFDETRAVTPLATVPESHDVPDTYPFGV